MDKKSQISPKSIKSPPSKISLAEQIVTPEKSAEIPRRGRNSKVVLSVTQVRKVAKGLQRQPVGGKKINNDDDLAVVEKIVKKIPKAKAIVKLPDIYEMLIEFFNSMVSSIRLLRLRGSLTSLSNICNRIESLTNRRFTSRHLAQLNYIFPEALLIKKVMVHDEIMCCMKSDFQIALQLDAVQDFSKHKGDTAYSALMKIFRERIGKFYMEHPEGDDVPEQELPELSNKRKTIELPTVPCSSSGSSNSVTSNNIPSLMSSHLPRSFQRIFSIRSSKRVTENRPSTDDPLFSFHSSPSVFSSEPPMDQVTQTQQQNESGCDSGCPGELNMLVGTPAKTVLTPAKLMTSTPDIGASKTFRPTMAYDTPPVNKSVKRTARVLSFHTPNKKIIVEDEKREDDCSPLKDDELSFLPESLLRSLKEKERKTLEERKDGAVEAKRREKMIACLPTMFNLIHLIYQRGCRSVMTKQELFHKIISGHCKITDRSEIEEQLLLLQEIASDWISVKNASSGDTLYCVNKLCSPDEIRERLAEAKQAEIS